MEILTRVHSFNHFSFIMVQVFLHVSNVYRTQLRIIYSVSYTTSIQWEDILCVSTYGFKNRSNSYLQWQTKSIPFLDIPFSLHILFSKNIPLRRQRDSFSFLNKVFFIPRKFKILFFSEDLFCLPFQKCDCKRYEFNREKVQCKGLFWGPIIYKWLRRKNICYLQRRWGWDSHE